jgi:hypothetical protein
VRAAKHRISELNKTKAALEASGRLAEATATAQQLQDACIDMESLCPNGAGSGKVKVIKS